jgi:hypothetical protein
MPHTWQRQRPSCLIGLALLLSACSTLQLPDYEKPQGVARSSQSDSGLEVFADALTAKAEIKRLFGVDLLSAGILPIFVSATNRSESSSFLLTQEHFALSSGTLDLRSGSTGADAKSETLGTTFAMVGAAGSPLLLLMGVKMVSNATVINQNFKTKEFHSTTISPGREAHGFVYFRIPKEAGESGIWSLHLEASELKTGGIRNFNLQVNSRRN